MIILFSKTMMNDVSCVIDSWMLLGKELTSVTVVLFSNETQKWKSKQVH